ncbi:MAG: DUF554 domain-containing protein [Bacteroidales bacterium]|nr:DUF554 domain-containing protein [Bacteroidales bacterium]
MTGTLINVMAVALGSTLGIALHSRLPQRAVETLFQANGLFTIALGVSMALKANEWMIVIVSLLLGSVAGELLNLELIFNEKASLLGSRLKLGNQGFTEGMLTAFLLFCMGSMTILGAIEEGMSGRAELLYIKSLMDGISSVALASGLGWGVLFSIVPLFAYQASLTLLAAGFGQFMPDLMINSISSTGGVILIGLGLNLTGISKLRIINMLPALIFVILGTYLFLWINPVH